MRIAFTIFVALVTGCSGCVAARNRFDRFVAGTEKVTGAAVAGVGSELLKGIIEAPFNMLDHAIAKEVDPDHSCQEDPHDVCNDDEGWAPQTTGIVSDEFSQWK